MLINVKYVDTLFEKAELQLSRERGASTFNWVAYLHPHGFVGQVSFKIEPFLQKHLTRPWKKFRRLPLMAAPRVGGCTADLSCPDTSIHGGHLQSKSPLS